MLFAAVPILFEETRGWNTLVGSLPFLAVLVGTFVSSRRDSSPAFITDMWLQVAAGINILYSQTIFQRKLKENGGRAPPEARLIPAMLGGVMFPVAFFLVGWTSFAHIFWFPEVVGLALLGTSFLLVFQSSVSGAGQKEKETRLTRRPGRSITSSTRTHRAQSRPWQRTPFCDRSLRLVCPWWRNHFSTISAISGRAPFSAALPSCWHSCHSYSTLKVHT